MRKTHTLHLFNIFTFLKQAWDETLQHAHCLQLLYKFIKKLADPIQPHKKTWARLILTTCTLSLSSRLQIYIIKYILYFFINLYNFLSPSKFLTLYLFFSKIKQTYTKILLFHTYTIYVVSYSHKLKHLIIILRLNHELPTKKIYPSCVSLRMERRTWRAYVLIKTTSQPYVS